MEPIPTVSYYSRVCQSLVVSLKYWTRATAWECNVSVKDFGLCENYCWSNGALVWKSSNTFVKVSEVLWLVCQCKSANLFCIGVWNVKRIICLLYWNTCPKFKYAYLWAMNLIKFKVFEQVLYICVCTWLCVCFLNHIASIKA